MFAKLMLSPKLSPAEKFETVYLAPYYLQALFFLVGTLSWLISETIFKVRLPFWTELWGWSLVLTNMISLPLLNSVGLFLEESDQKDYLGISSFIALSYIVVPFQAYAAVKGFLEKEEGPWFRTPKTGRITDVFKRGKFYKFISDILPARIAAQSVASGSGSPYLALTTANNRFDNFTIKPRNARWIGKTVAVVVIILSLLINSMGFYVKPALAAGWYDNNWADRQRVTVNASKVGGSLTNYPVYVNLADLGNSVHYLESSQSDFSSGTLTNVTATVSGQLQLDPSGGSVDDGSSLSSWTNSGATVDNTNGNPLPSFKATGGHYAYKNVNITSNEILEFDVYVIPGSVDLCNFYFMTDSSGQGQMFRFESRSGNSSGFASTTSWGSWNAPSGQGVISAGVWHHARLVFGSTSVSGYVDGTSYGSYTFANKGGYIAVHGDGGSVTGGEFDNITINNGFVSSGNRVSNTVDLSGAQTVASSTISWTTITPANTTVSLSSRISTDGGNNWSAYQTDTSGSSIPGLTTNMNLSNVKLQLQEDLSTTDIMATPLLQSVTVLVTGSGGFFSNVKSDGSDIVVTASDGTTKLSRELVSINTTNSTGELYFNAPSLSNSSNTDFYVYYGNSSGSETNSTATWDSNYQGVWHFNEDTGTNTADSTSNGNVGTLTNSPSWTTGGNPYNAISYSGGTDYTNTNYVQNSVTAYTISAWIKTTDAGAEKTIVQDRGSGAGLSLTLGIGATGGQHGGPGDVGFEVDSNSIDIGVSSTKAVNDNIWHQVVGVWSAPASTAVAASQFTIYIDGQAATTTTGTAGSTTSPLTGSGGTKIARHDAWTTNLNATLDEIRISTSTRTAAWILTDYNNTSNTTTFYTVAASETVPEFSLPLLPLAIVIPLFVSYIIKKDKKERRLVYE
jgi:hypothetical protein